MLAIIGLAANFRGSTMIVCGSMFVKQLVKDEPLIRKNSAKVDHVKY